MHFYFDITLQFLIMKKDLKLHFYLLYIHVYFIYTCIQISSLVCVPSLFYWQKSYIHQRSEHIFLKQVSINICKTLDWVVCLSEFPPLFFFCYLGQTRVVWTVQISPADPILLKNYSVIIPWEDPIYTSIPFLSAVPESTSTIWP